MPQRYKDWFRQAEADLKAARDLYATENWAWCCFACQQAAEKALRALLDFYRASTRGHNLVELLRQVEQYVSAPDTVRRGCYVLNRYYISTRYPSAFPSGAPADMFTREDAEEALRYAEEIVNFARRVILEASGSS